MTGEKHGSRYRKSRKGKGFSGVAKYEKATEETASEECEMPQSNPGASNVQSDTESEDSPNEPEHPLSASRKKMKLHASEDYNSQGFEEETVAELSGDGYRLVHLKNLSSVLSSVHRCEEANLTVEENSAARAGLMSDLSLCCDGCDQSTSMQTSINITQRGKSYDVNRRAVYHALESGSGYEGLASFCGVMNMPCLSLSAYHKQVDTILDGLEDVTKEELVNAGQRLRKLQKRLRKADNQATTKEKKHRQGLQLIRTRREEALREMEDVTYEAGGF